MLAKLRSRIRRPGPATAIAFVALVFAMAGGAVAKDKVDKDEVTNVTTTGGPISTTGPGNQDAIPLDNPTFTQKAGEVVLVSATADVSGVDQGTATCDLFVQVNPAGEGQGKELGLFMQQQARRGDAGDLGDSQALPAPTSDREITLSAFASESEFEELSEEGDCGDDEFTVSLRVSITTLRN